MHEATGIAVEHVHRYELAAALATGLRVVDLACGVGYGSEILSRHAATVLGIDIDLASVDLATHTFQDRENLDFAASDALTWLRRADASEFDLLVCFEGIEHFPEIAAIREQLARLAADGVRMILSVPNGEAFAEENEFHETQFSYERAREFFGAIDEEYVLILQSNLEGSLFVGPDGPLSENSRLRWPERAEEEYANHYVALIGELVPPVEDASAVVSFAPVYNRYMLNLERANLSLWRTNGRLARNAFARSGSGGASYLRSQAQKIERYEARIRELEDQLRALHCQIDA
ncbi:MAG: methyltransferase domain-containing protein [Patulibacter sp.]